MISIARHVTSRHVALCCVVFNCSCGKLALVYVVGGVGVWYWYWRCASRCVALRFVVVSWRRRVLLVRVVLTLVLVFVSMLALVFCDSKLVFDVGVGVDVWRQLKWVFSWCLRALLVVVVLVFDVGVDVWRQLEWVFRWHWRVLLVVVVLVVVVLVFDVGVWRWCGCLISVRMGV